MQFRLKFIYQVLLWMILSGCVHKIPLNGDELCANNGLISTGEDIAHSIGSSTIGEDIGFFHSTSVTEKCSKTKSPEENCNIKAYNKSRTFKDSFNSQVGGRNLLIGFGYIAYIVPGVLLYLYFDDDQRVATTVSKSLSDTTIEACQKELQKENTEPASPTGS